MVIAPDDVPAAAHAACSWCLAWSVPSSVKYRNAVNCASMRFNQDEFVGELDVARLGPASDPALPPGGQGRAEGVAGDRDPGRERGAGPQVAAEFQERGPGLAGPDVPEQPGPGPDVFRGRVSVLGPGGSAGGGVSVRRSRSGPGR